MDGLQRGQSDTVEKGCGERLHDTCGCKRDFPGFTEDSAERASLSASQAGLGCKRTTRILPYRLCLWRNADSSKAEKSRVVRHKAEHSVSHVNTSELGESNLSCGIRPQQIQQ